MNEQAFFAPFHDGRSCYSDVIVQIVDARNPLLFHCEDLVSVD